MVLSVAAIGLFGFPLGTIVSMLACAVLLVAGAWSTKRGRAWSRWCALLLLGLSVLYTAVYLS